MMSPIDSRILDINSESLGVDVFMLMDNAGHALANVLKERFEGKKILIICGRGNNGGDGLAAAYHLRNTGTDVMVISPEKGMKTEPSKKMLERCHVLPFDMLHIDKYDVIADCVLGTGIHGDMVEEYSDYVKKINEYRGTVVSADIPTGFGTGLSVVPDITVTFHDKKENMNKKNCGEIIVCNIGIPADAYFAVGPGDMLRYPIPKKDSHKGQNGRLLIIGGGPYVGAPAIAGMSALRMGADIVRIITPERCFVPMASFDPSFIVHPVPGDIITEEHIDRIIEISKEVNAVLIGPGLGTDERTQCAVRRIIEECSVPMIVDASGITAIAGHNIRKMIAVTPHMDEMNRLTGKQVNDNPGTIIDFSKKTGMTILLKGVTDMIFCGDRLRVNRTGTSAMTVGGTGDALSGAVASLVSKGMNMFDASCLAAFVCGKAGEKAFAEFSYGMTATDMIMKIPSVLKDYLKG